jgi:tetratricopeptide (TPR) repeat protein
VPLTVVVALSDMLAGANIRSILGVVIRSRSAVLALFVILVTLMAKLAAADQSDPRLGDLFAQLRAADSAQAAQPVEARIWAIWMEAGDPAADRLMASGVVAMNAGDYDAALKIFGRLVEFKPAFAEGWNKRATLLYLLGRYRESVADIAKVLALEPRHFGALSGLALCDGQLGKDADALRALRRVAAVYPNMPGLKGRIDELTKKVEGEPT